jgi:glycosyltransferase involved in cell wall biosynthesis
MTRKDICFTVIIPLFNKEISISSTIESVLNQTFSRFELLIINDGSTDSSLAVASSFRDERIKIFSQPNEGVSSTRNFGINNASHQYLSFLDADDVWKSDCLEEFCRLIIEFPEANVFCTNYNMTGKNIKGSQKRYYVRDRYNLAAYYLAKWSIPLMITGCVAIHKDQFKKAGLFNPLLTHGEDVDMWERISECSLIAKSEKVTTIYRTEAENRATFYVENSNYFKKPPINNKKSITDKSQKLFHGVEMLFSIISNYGERGRLGELFSRFKYWDWMTRAALFIIKYRVFNCKYSPRT